MKLSKTLKNIVTEASTLNDYLSSRGINPKFVSRDTKISHAKSAEFQKWKNDRKMTEETILETSESDLLSKFLSSRGINAKYATKEMKIAHSKSGEFLKWKKDHMFESAEEVNEVSMDKLSPAHQNHVNRGRIVNINLGNKIERPVKTTKVQPKPKKGFLNKIFTTEETDKKDMVCFDIPLLIRVLEYTREDMKTDIELHNMVERLINMRETYPLTMKEYDTITSNLVKENHIAIAMGKMLDDESGMVLSQIEELERGCAMIRSYIGKDYEKQLPAWVQAKITLATDYMSTVGNYLVSKNEKVNEEVLDEAKKPRTTALDRWRKAAAEREKKHNDIEKVRQEKLHQDPSTVTVPVANTKKDDLSTAIDKLEKHLNKEDVEQIDETPGAQAMKASGVKQSPDKLLARTGMNMAHKFPRKGQTNLGNIPGINTPGVSKDTADYAEKRRGDRAKELKPAIKAALGTHGPKGKLPEEVEQIDELKKSTVFSWLKQQPVVPEKKPNMDKKAHNQKIKTHNKSWNRALDRLSGYKPTSENTLDSMAATEAPSDCSDNTNSTPTTGKSYAARMVKSLKKTVKEETYDWEKDDKSSMQKPYGKAPKINVTDKKGTLGDTKPEARAVMKGGTTLTGQPRDMVEIDPSMKQRPGQQDKGQSTFTSAIAKKSPNNT